MLLTSPRSAGSRTMRSTFKSSNEYHYGESWRRSGNTHPKPLNAT